MNFIHSLLYLLQHGRSSQDTIYTSLEDDLFADREQSYGSYELRKNQPWYLLTATGLVLSSVLCLVFVPIWMGWHLPEETLVIHSDPYEYCCCIGFSPPPPPVIAQGQMMTCRLIPKKEIDLIDFYIPKPAQETFFLEEANPKVMKEISQPTGTENGHTLKDCIDCKEHSLSFSFPQIDDFTFVDQEPQPVNLSEIKQRIHFPQGHRSGHVVFRILVDEQGNTVKHQVINQADEMFISAISPHIQELRWTPALQEGKAIPFWVNIPFTFRGLRK